VFSAKTFHKRSLATFALLCVLLGLAPMAGAAFIALDSTRGIGNQTFNGSLGMHFDVLSPISVTHLGAFDSSQDGFANEISVGIFDRNTQALVSEVAVFNGTSSPLIGQSRFADISDVVLGIGSYAIVAQGFGVADPNGNGPVSGTPTIDTGGGLIAFVGGGAYNFSAVLDYPTIPDDGPANRYDAGTFQFTAAVAVPAPQALCLFSLGLLAMAGIKKRAS